MVGMRGMKDVDLHLDAILVGAAVTGLYLWWKSYDSKLRTILPSPVSLPVQGVETHRQSVFHADEKILSSPQASTITDLFEKGLSIDPSGRLFGTREGEGPYRWIKWNKADQIIKEFRRGLIKLGQKPGQETFLGIFAKNSPQWHMSMQAAVGNTNIAVPLYLTLGDKAMKHILEETKLSVIVCENSSVSRLLEFVSEGTHIEIIITVGGITDNGVIEKLRAHNIQFYEWDAVRWMGSQMPDRTEFQSPTQDDIAIICYTSGTTGKPKGAMLSHGNIVSCMKMTWRQMWKFQPKFNKEETVISYLPLAHVYGFVAECIMLFVGGKIGYYRGDVKTLLDDIQELKPTIFPTVPRVLNKVYDKVNAQLDAKPFVVKNAFNYGVGCKVAEVEQGIVRNDSVWDSLFFKKIQEKLGGRVKIILSGSAPMQDHVIQWFRAVLGTNIIEAYGQTETSASSSMYLLGDTVPGHVGVPGPEWQIKLSDVPEMGYFVRDNKGEVCVKGPGVFKGYYKQPDLTDEVLDGDWLHSGDIGSWTPEGRLQLIDRRKNIFKLSQGEYIAPEKIEIVYERCPYVAQVYVHGESLKSCLIALVVLDEEYLSTCPPPAPFSHIPLDLLSESKEFTEFVMEAMRRTGDDDLNSLEQVKRIKLYPESAAFSVGNDMMTPTFKKKRHNIRDTYRKELEKLYVGLD